MARPAVTFLPIMTSLRSLLLAAAVSAFAVLPVVAQQTPGAEAMLTLVTRVALEDLATRLEQTAVSRSFSSAVRADAGARAARVRARLRDGDFQVGDRIQLTVDNETTLTSTFAVLSGRQVALPGVGLLPMAGVLRVELVDHVTRFLSQYLRDPKVRALSLIRVMVTGGVTKQGYHTVPVDITVDSVFGIAGGLSTIANLDKISVERDGEVLYDGALLQRLISDGATLDALSVRQGDRIVILETPPVNPLQRVQTVTYLLTLPITIYSLISIFKN